MDKKQKKKIVIVSDFALPKIDGVAIFIKNLQDYFDKKDDEFEIHTIAPETREKRKRPPEKNITRVPLSRLRFGDHYMSKSPSRKLLKAIDDADLVFIQSLGPIGTAGINYAKKRRKKILAYTHVIEWTIVAKSLSRLNLFRTSLTLLSRVHAIRMYKKCDALIVPSADIAELHSAHGVKVPKYVIHLGVDTSRFKPGSKKHAREELDLPQDHFIVGYVGRIAREKDLLTLKRAFKRLDAEKKILLIVGEGIEEIKEELADKDIRITGMEKDVVPYLNAMDLFVMPSLTETTCLAMLEAMSCGLPVIGTKVGNMRFYIKNRENGFLIPKKGYTALSLRMQEVKDNLIKYNQMGKNAREYIQKEYGKEKMYEKISFVIQKMISPEEKKK